MPGESFPTNYVNAIQKEIATNSKLTYLFISTHESVRKELTKRGIPYIIVVPEDSALDRQVYLTRLLKRGSSYELIEKVYYNWYKWLDSVNNDTHPIFYLKHGLCLYDLLN